MQRKRRRSRRSNVSSLSLEADDEDRLLSLVENGTILSLPHLDTTEDFWDVIRSLADVLLAGYDLFIATPPVTQNRSKFEREECRSTSVFCIFKVLVRRRRFSIHQFHRVSDQKVREKH